MSRCAVYRNEVHANTMTNDGAKTMLALEQIARELSPYDQTVNLRNAISKGLITSRANQSWRQ
ncbi:hypothetical protein Tamer19_45210 [Cupriavidus sp. TA19]|nr:hypothetical protein Tamer19_45210 [Cupriavidus sp. TA19]